MCALPNKGFRTLFSVFSRQDIHIISPTHLKLYAATHTAINISIKYMNHCQAIALHIYLFYRTTHPHIQQHFIFAHSNLFCVSPSLSFRLFLEPTAVDYNLYSSSLPSEIEQCWNSSRARLWQRTTVIWNRCRCVLRSEMNKHGKAFFLFFFAMHQISHKCNTSDLMNKVYYSATSTPKCEFCPHQIENTISCLVPSILVLDSIITNKMSSLLTQAKCRGQCNVLGNISKRM